MQIAGLVVMRSAGDLISRVIDDSLEAKSNGFVAVECLKR